MKDLLTTICTFSFLMMVSCSDDEPTSIKQGGYVTARINGVDFESVQVIGKLNTQPNQSMVIYAEDSHDDSNHRELGLSIGFSGFETIVTGIEYNDQQALPIVFHQYAKLVNGQYAENANSTGTGSAILEFTNIDRKKQQISGSFYFTGKDFFTSEEYKIAEGVFTGWTTTLINPVHLSDPKWLLIQIKKRESFFRKIPVFEYLKP